MIIPITRQKWIGDNRGIDSSTDKIAELCVLITSDGDIPKGKYVSIYSDDHNNTIPMGYEYQLQEAEDYQGLTNSWHPDNVIECAPGSILIDARKIASDSSDEPPVVLSTKSSSSTISTNNNLVDYFEKYIFNGIYWVKCSTISNSSEEDTSEDTTTK